MKFEEATTSDEPRTGDIDMALLKVINQLYDKILDNARTGFGNLFTTILDLDANTSFDIGDDKTMCGIMFNMKFNKMFRDLIPNLKFIVFGSEFDNETGNMIRTSTGGYHTLISSDEDGTESQFIFINMRSFKRNIPTNIKEFHNYLNDNKEMHGLFLRGKDSVINTFTHEVVHAFDIPNKIKREVVELQKKKVKDKFSDEKGAMSDEHYSAYVNTHHELNAHIMGHLSKLTNHVGIFDERLTEALQWLEQNDAGDVPERYLETAMEYIFFTFDDVKNGSWGLGMDNEVSGFKRFLKVQISPFYSSYINKALKDGLGKNMPKFLNRLYLIWTKCYEWVQFVDNMLTKHGYDAEEYKFNKSKAVQPKMSIKDKRLAMMKQKGFTQESQLVEHLRADFDYKLSLFENRNKAQYMLSEGSNDGMTMYDLRVLLYLLHKEASGSAKSLISELLKAVIKLEMVNVAPIRNLAKYANSNKSISSVVNK